MVSAINTKKSKGSRTGAGGGRPRFRGTLTLRILTLNMIAPLVLLIGVLYTGEYRENLISADLETIKAHAQLFSGAISESAIRPAVGAPIPLFAHAETQDVLSPTVSRRIIRRLTEDTDNRARIFDFSGRLIGDSVEMNRPVKTPQPPTSPAQRALANSLRFGMHGVLTLFPTESKLHPYSTINSADIKDHPDAAGALHGKTGGTAWSGDDRGDVILSAATAIRHGRQVMGVVLLTREADDVEDAMVRVRFEVFSAFLVALSVTILLSLYLASTIGRPLRRLAIAAEAIRRSKTRAAADIPDLSARRDEIGELSLALREMTQALWDRMDSIENFAADVAHEIKNPLTSLRSASRNREPRQKRQRPRPADRDYQSRRAAARSPHQRHLERLPPRCGIVAGRNGRGGSSPPAPPARRHTPRAPVTPDRRHGRRQCRHRRRAAQRAGPGE